MALGGLPRILNNTGLCRVKTAHRASGTWAYANAYGSVALGSLAAGLFVVPTDGYLGLPDCRFFVSGGAGTNNQAVSGRLLTISRRMLALNEDRAAAGLTEHYVLQRAATFTATIGQGAGIAGSVVLDTDRLVDGLSALALTAWGTHLQTVYGFTIAAYNPADDSEASLAIGDGCDVFAWAFDFDTTGAAAVTGINMLVRRGGM